MCLPYYYYHFERKTIWQVLNTVNAEIFVGLIFVAEHPHEN